MVFSSLIFLFLFLPSVKLTNFIFIKRIKLQNFMLMMFSLLFYYWGEKDHIFIMLACIFVNYLCGILIEQSQEEWRRKLNLTIAIVVSIGLLGYFKYFNFFLSTTTRIFNLDVTNFAKIALPLGISFYTFHALSYVIDVYWRKVKAEYNFVIFVGYVSLFPQLVAGPIVRYRDIRHSFYRRYITRAGLRNGILRFSFGLGKKILIANTVAVLADIIFSLPQNELNFGLVWLGALAYMIQIYFDFSGYSDMAIGIGLMLGFKYKENFKFPYRSLSIQEFWRRWHISLSSWFRDYVYIPLGGSRKSTTRTYCNLIIIFVLCGLWHGANYTFIAWGLFHGAFLVLERTSFGKLIQQLPNFFRHSYALLVVLVGWVFFRADNIHLALGFIKKMFTPSNIDLSAVTSQMNGYVILAFLLGTVLSLGMNDYIKNYLKNSKNRQLIIYYKQISILLGLFILAISILPLSNNSYSPFLYFRF